MGFRKLKGKTPPEPNFSIAVSLEREMHIEIIVSVNMQWVIVKYIEIPQCF